MSCAVMGLDFRFGPAPGDCPICLEQTDEPHVLLDCGHSVCAACVRAPRWKSDDGEPDPRRFGCPERDEADPADEEGDDMAYDAWVETDTAAVSAFDRACDDWEYDMHERREERSAALAKCPLCRHPTNIFK